MEELIVNKTFNTREELDAYEKELNDMYSICMIFRKAQIVGEPEVYGIDSVLHFGKRK